MRLQWIAGGAILLSFGTALGYLIGLVVSPDDGSVEDLQEETNTLKAAVATAEHRIGALEEANNCTVLAIDKFGRAVEGVFEAQREAFRASDFERYNTLVEDEREAALTFYKDWIRCLWPGAAIAE